MSSLLASVLDKFRLTGKTIVITGGSRGLGLEFGRALASVGANIAAIDLGNEASKEFSELSSLYKDGKFRYYESDVTDYNALKQTIDQVHKEFGSIDGCVPAAGIIRDRPFLEHTEADFRATIDVNVNGVMFTVQHCAAQMVSQGTGGSIVCIASTAGHKSLYPQTITAYTASKYAVRGIVKQVAHELAQHNVRVNSISPGVILTDMLEAVMKQNPSRRKLFEETNAMGRLASPSELAGIMVYLMSDASSFTTGQDFLIDGGMV